MILDEADREVALRCAGRASDADDLRDFLQMLGFMPTERPAVATTTATGRRKYPTKPQGRCPVCRRRVAVKLSGLLGSHFANDMEREHCDGENERPVAEEPA